MNDRKEHDMLGEKMIPKDAAWGIHTARALENFPFPGERVPLALIRAIALVKKAACEANEELGYVSLKKAGAIKSACDEVIAGRFDDAFVLPALQGGAGTSTNMNVNEVVARRASELLGAPVHPLDDVNMHQSTNDVYPTAVKIAGIGFVRELSEAVALLQGAFQRKEKEFAGVVKIGRTELQDAVPMTLGAEFSAWAEAISRDRWRTFKCEERLRVVNIGGTAVGTGLGAPREYIFLVIEKLRALTGMGLARGENPVAETSNADVFVEVSGILKAHASNLVKIAGDLRLLNMLGEIHLPALQAGSSIMPGKVNPVLLESVMQAGLKVMAGDFLVTEAASRGTLQINEFMPLLASEFIFMIELLRDVNKALALHIEGITADEAQCRYYFDHNRSIVTAFVPQLGYDACAVLLKDFDVQGGGNLRVFLEKKIGTEKVRDVLSPENLVSLGYRKKG